MAKYIAPGKASKIYEDVCKTYEVSRPNFNHYLRYYCINCPTFTELLKSDKENHQRWAQEFIAEREQEWKQIREKRYKKG
jgi:hypothetical protein